MPEVRANGVTLYYEEHGSGDPIVCIHGTSSSALVWGSALDSLAQRGRAIAYDRRGCFRSERPDPYVTDVHQHADDAAALIAALDAAPAIVIGRSYGGETAIDLALRYPERVRALALLEATPFALSKTAAQWAATIDELVLDAAAADMDSVAETFLRAVVGDDAWEAFPDATKEMFRANGPAIVAEIAGGLLEITEEQLASIGHPTLLVAAEGSPAAFAEVTELMAAAMPNAGIARVGGGHLIDPVHPAVLGFVDAVLAGDA